MSVAALRWLLLSAALLLGGCDPTPPALSADEVVAAMLAHTQAPGLITARNGAGGEAGFGFGFTTTLRFDYSNWGAEFAIAPPR